LREFSNHALCCHLYAKVVDKFGRTSHMKQMLATQTDTSLGTVALVHLIVSFDFTLHSNVYLSHFREVYY